MIVGMVSTRFAGLDGVTLESAKVAEVLREAGHQVVWFAGELGPEFQPGVEHRPAFFGTEDNMSIQHDSFGSLVRSPDTTRAIRRLADELTLALRTFVSDFSIDVVIPQNALSIPMQLPLGMAITDVILESGIPTIAHHHDFSWERTRFWPNAVGDILSAYFPPSVPGMHHLVINSIALEELARRRGVAGVVVPNVMDFEHAPGPTDEAAFRNAAGLSHRDLVLLQPTRRIPRKQIELTLELARRLDDDRVKVVVTHPETDEEGDYWEFLVEQAGRSDVDLRFVPVGLPGTPSLEQAYAAADLVAFPSSVEGFGNALLEAMYYRKPIYVNRYPVYTRDIAPTGVRCIEIDGRLTQDAVDQAAVWLADPSAWSEAVETNYQVGLAHFSHEVLRRRILPLLSV